MRYFLSKEIEKVIKFPGRALTIVISAKGIEALRGDLAVLNTIEVLLDDFVVLNTKVECVL